MFKWAPDIRLWRRRMIGSKSLQGEAIPLIIILRFIPFCTKI